MIGIDNWLSEHNFTSNELVNWAEKFERSAQHHEEIERFLEESGWTLREGCDDSKTLKRTARKLRALSGTST